MNNRTRFRSFLIFALVIATGAASTPTRGEANLVRGTDALEEAFRFASAIHSHPKDQAKAQEKVVQALARAGALDAAIQKAEQIQTWRRGTALADLATRLARQGKADSARDLIARAEKVRPRGVGWETDRIRAHTSLAYGALGELEKVREIGRSLERDEGVKALVALAAAQAARGEFDEAMKTMAGLDAIADYHVGWWRTEGYVTLAQDSRLTGAQRARALDAAVESTKNLPGWKRVEALMLVADELRAVGRPEEARKAVGDAEADLLAGALAAHARIPLLSQVAGAWGRLDEKNRALPLLQKAEESIPALQSIEQPAAYARVAGGYAAAGEIKEAWRLYHKALEVAQPLLNSRPRALAVVEVCLSMGAHQLALTEEARVQLQTLHSGLKDPW